MKWLIIVHLKDGDYRDWFLKASFASETEAIAYHKDLIKTKIYSTVILASGNPPPEPQEAEKQKAKAPSAPARKGRAKRSCA